MIEDIKDSPNEPLHTFGDEKEKEKEKEKGTDKPRRVSRFSILPKDKPKKSDKKIDNPEEITKKEKDKKSNKDLDKIEEKTNQVEEEVIKKPKKSRFTITKTPSPFTKE